MIVEQIPKNSRFFSTSTEMSAVYNAVTPGYYDFAGTATCQDVIATEMQPGSIYLVESITVGGNVPEYDYTGSIDVFPKLTLKNSLRKDFIYRYPIPIPKYFDGMPAEAYYKAESSNSNLTVSLSGRCVQLASMVGVTTLTLMISLNMFAIDDRYFNEAFRGNTGRKIADKLQGV